MYETEKLLDRIAPCSLLCYTCTGFRDGPVSACAGQLSVYLEGFCEMRETYLSEDARKAWRSQFDEFHNTLKHMSGGSCPGCRKGPVPAVSTTVSYRIVQRRTAWISARNAKSFPAGKRQTFLQLATDVSAMPGKMETDGCKNLAPRLTSRKKSTRRITYITKTNRYDRNPREVTPGFSCRVLRRNYAFPKGYPALLCTLLTRSTARFRRYALPQIRRRRCKTCVPQVQIRPYKASACTKNEY